MSQYLLSSYELARGRTSSILPGTRSFQIGGSLLMKLTLPWGFPHLTTIQHLFSDFVKSRGCTVFPYLTLICSTSISEMHGSSPSHPKSPVEEMDCLINM